MTVTLRPLQPGDEEVAVRWATDADFCRAADWSVGLSARVVRRHWQALMAGNDPEFLRLGVEHAGRLAGYVDLAQLSRQSGEFGIAVGERALWGQGVGARAGQLLLAHAFDTLGLAWVSAQVHAGNARSRALMTRLGFRPVGQGPPAPYQGQSGPVLAYQLTAAEFRRGGGP